MVPAKGESGAARLPILFWEVGDECGCYLLRFAGGIGGDFERVGDGRLFVEDHEPLGEVFLVFRAYERRFRTPLRFGFVTCVGHISSSAMMGDKIRPHHPDPPALLYRAGA
jgi:hypothetical protein